MNRWTSALNARLQPLFRRYGRNRVYLAFGCVAFLVLGEVVIAVVQNSMIRPEIQFLAQQAGVEPGPVMARIRLAGALSLIIISALGFAIWWLAVMESFTAFRRRVRTRLASSASDELGVLSYWYERRSSQLEAALHDNRSFREQLSQLSTEQQSILLSREAMLTMTQDAMLLADVHGVVIGASPATATLLHRTREDLAGMRFDEAVPLFDHRVEVPQDHPLKDYLGTIIEGGSTSPRLDQALLINMMHEPIPVLITTSAITDSAGSALGAMVRINRLDANAETATQHYRAAEELEVLSLPQEIAPTRDWATDLSSKEVLDKQIDELTATGAELGLMTSHALLLVRVDDLTRINDAHGFWAGEQALWHAAQTLNEALESQGTAYRISSSRFATVLKDCSEETAGECAERIRDAAERRELVWEGKPISCTLSVVIVMLEPGLGRQALFAKAESLLDEAKARGGNLVLRELPDDALTLRRREDQHWLTWLLPRLEDGRAHLIRQVMQPLSPDSDRPCFEVFLRVEDDDGVWLEPSHYMPALGRLHRTIELDLWVLKNLLGKLERDETLLEQHAMACLNFAATSLTDVDFGPRVFELLAGARVPPSRLCFEIDEAFAIAQSAALQRFMDMTRPTGVRFALDRCHTTMGITHLRHLPVDTMKIHPRVTRHVESDPLDRTHLEWICQAANLLGRKTAAINIESPAKLEWLRRAGVSYAQGFAVGKFEMMLG